MYLHLPQFWFCCGISEGVQNKLVNVDESIYLPVTKAELAVLSSIFNVSLSLSLSLSLICQNLHCHNSLIVQLERCSSRHSSNQNLTHVLLLNCFALIVLVLSHGFSFVWPNWEHAFCSKKSSNLTYAKIYCLSQLSVRKRI